MAMLVDSIDRHMRFKDIDEAFQLANTLIELPNYYKKVCKEQYIPLLQKCYDYIINNLTNLKYVDQYVILLNMVLCEEFQNHEITYDKKCTVANPILLMKTLGDDFGSKLHDVSKVDLVNIIYRVFKSKSKDSDHQIEQLLDLFKNANLISSTYHHEISNF
jgi:hypothetical protein